jgi:hypothetical protein
MLYVTLEEAEAIQAERLSTDIWDNADDDIIKTNALREAERLLNYHIKWSLPVNEFNEIQADTIPSQIKRGVVALAQMLIEESNIEDDDMSGIESFKVTDIEIKTTGKTLSQTNPVPDSIVSYLYPYGRKKIKKRPSIVLVRG